MLDVTEDLESVLDGRGNVPYNGDGRHGASSLAGTYAQRPCHL
jgi:hypothetical protein